MLKLLSMGLVGMLAVLSGMWLDHFLDNQTVSNTSAKDGKSLEAQVKTEMTGIPVVANGMVSGYLVFQISSTVDTAKLAVPEFDVAPYLLDAAIRASYQSTQDPHLEFNAKFLETLAEQVRIDANTKLAGEIVKAVNVQQFNFVPKSEVRGNVLAGEQK
jgi:hypothetical protein